MTIRKMMLTGMVLLTTATATTFAQTQPAHSGHPHLTPDQKAARHAENKAKLAAMSPAEHKAFRHHREQREARLAAMSPEKRQRVMERRQMRKQGK